MTRYTTSQKIHLSQMTRFLTDTQAALPALVYKVSASHEGLLIRTSPSKLRALLLFLRNSSALRFTILADIAVVDLLSPT